MTAVQAVIFDLDGTLVDSAPDIADALNEALGARGLAPLGLETVKGLVGAGARRLVERALVANAAPDVSVEDVLAAFLDAYRARPQRLTHLYPGALELLRALRADGVKLGVATNKPDDLTRAILDAVGLRQLFQVATGSIPGAALKPDPELLHACLAGLGVAPRSAVMVGDSSADLGAAKAAGVRCVLVRHGYSTEPLEGLGADVVIDGFANLGAALDALTKT